MFDGAFFAGIGWAIGALLLLGVPAGVLLGYAAIRFRVERDPIADQIDNLLPQTQCGQCGYPGCRPYAEAIAGSAAPINRCPPGGEATVQALAELLNVETLPLDAPAGEQPKRIAFIREAECIGCTKCIQACPVDAIVGAPRLMHTVIAGECTGCDLCVAPCPVDCIDMVPLDRAAPWRQPQTVVLSLLPVDDEGEADPHAQLGARA